MCARPSRAAIPRNRDKATWDDRHEMSPKRKHDVGRRKHECNRVSGWGRRTHGWLKRVASLLHGEGSSPRQMRSRGRLRTWPRYAYSSSPGCAGEEAAALVLATQEFVANSGRLPSHRRRRSAASPGRTGSRDRVARRGGGVPLRQRAVPRAALLHSADAAVCDPASACSPLQASRAWPS